MVPNKRKLYFPGLILLSAFIIRIGGILFTNLIGLNPDQGADTVQYAEWASGTASGMIPITESLSSLGNQVPTWGLFISPFWLFPGPSEVYAQIFVGLLGSFGIYNIYLLVRHYHSDQAAILTVIPLIILPSFVALHSVILRDAAILASLTYALRLIVIPYQMRKSMHITLIIFSIFIASILRIENSPIYLIIIISFICLNNLPKKYYLPVSLSVLISSILTYPLIVHILHWLGILRGRDGVFDFLLWMRRARISEGGRTQYLAEISIGMPTEVLIYAPLLGIYFLYVPFPWMVESFIDYFTALESITMILFSIFAVRGWVILSRRNFALAASLLIGFAAFVILYGTISVNVGTSVRQRQTFSWLIFALGAVGFTENYRIEFRSSEDKST